MPRLKALLPLTVALLVAASAPVLTPGQMQAKDDEWVELTVTRESHDGVPYIRIQPSAPRRTIILVHGGPHIPAGASTDFAAEIAAQWNAAVLVPIYYGSTERYAGLSPVRLTLPPEGEAIAGQALLNGVRKHFAGMPKAVRECDC